MTTALLNKFMLNNYTA